MGLIFEAPNAPPTPVARPFRRGQTVPFKTVHAAFRGADPIENANRAVQSIRESLADFPASLVIFFAATNYEPCAVAAGMHAAFPDAVTMGCSSAGEAEGALLLTGSVVAMAFTPNFFDHCRTALVLGDGQEADGGDVFTSIDDAMRHLADGSGNAPIDLDYRQFVGFMLADRISFFSEALLDRLGELTNAFFVGGFAGDDYKFTGEQVVYYRGRSCRAASVLALWKPKNGFSVLKTQAVGLMDKQFVITKADEYDRIIWEFNGEPAAQALSRLIGAPVETMGVLDFDSNPLALTADGEPFLRAMVKTVDGRGIMMFASVKEGTRLTLTRAGDILATTAADLEEKIRREGPFAALLHVNCASRHTTLKQWNQEEQFAELFRDLPNIAFSSYGEIHVGIVAMTSSMILFK